MDEISKEKPPKKLAKLPWQDSMDRILLGRTTSAILLGVFVAGIVLAGSSFGLGATLVAKVVVITGSVLALVAFTALAIRKWLCFEKKAANTMYASLTVEEHETHGLPEQEIQSKMYQNGTKMKSKITPNPLEIDTETKSLFRFIF